MRYVSVRAVDSGGRPVSNVRVALEIHQFAAGGVKSAETGSDGVARFELDVDTFAQVTVYAGGAVKVNRGSIQGEYIVSV